ncbi:MAG: PorV/PorQ family protein [Ignavibacteriales bacterium]|nr:PorV/PorQ family protein [Ignavibacteriales bacterium]
MNKLYIVFILSVLLFVQTTAQNKNVSKSGTTVAAFLEIPVGAKATGFGGAFVSLANDATALYWNAAGISNLQQGELSVTHTNWIAETSFDYAALVIPLGSLGNIGLSFTSLTMPDMKVRTVELPEGTGEYFSASDIALGISYAHILTDRFAIGFTAKYIQQKIWHESAVGFAIDAGTTFKTDLLNGMVIGASISNFGTSLQLTGRDTRKFGRVDDTKQGSNERIPFTVEMDSWDLPLSFQIGVSTNVVNSDDFKWTVALDALHPNNNYESVNTGTEVSYREILFLRGGWQSLFLDKAEGGLSLGVGIASKELFGSAAVQFDYAYRDFGRLEAVHFFSLGLKF